MQIYLTVWLYFDDKRCSFDWSGYGRPVPFQPGIVVELGGVLNFEVRHKVILRIVRLLYEDPSDRSLWRALAKYCLLINDTAWQAHANEFEYIADADHLEAVPEHLPIPGAS